MRVRDVMTTEVVTVRWDAPLKEAARRMVDRHLSGLPVVDDDGRVVGVVSEADLLEQEAAKGEGRPGLRLLDPDYWPRDRAPATVEEAMSRPPVTIHPETHLADAARKMVAKGVKRLPVIDERGLLVGILSRADVVAAFSRPDDVIEDEVREDVVRRYLGLQPAELAVEVDEGVVTVEGRVPLRSDAVLLDELVRRLEGVVRVENRLLWSADDLEPDAVEPLGPDGP